MSMARSPEEPSLSQSAEKEYTQKMTEVPQTSKDHVRTGQRTAGPMTSSPVIGQETAAASDPPRTRVASPEAADISHPSCDWWTRW